MNSSIKNSYSLLPHNTFHVDVQAKYFLDLQAEEAYSEVLSDPQYFKSNKLIIGEGSNILFTKDFDGLVIKNSLKGIRITEEDEDHVWIEAGSGVIWDDFVEFCVDNEYWGVENLSLIPGTVGAAPVQNIGAYGSELYDVFHHAIGFYLSDMEKSEFHRADCEFSYRNSVFKKRLRNEFLITKVIFKLGKHANPQLDYGDLFALKEEYGDEVTLRTIRDKVIAIRNSKLPDTDKIGNAGSFFKNPIIGKTHFDKLLEKYADLKYYKIDEQTYKLPAGWLIEKAGWKGARFGNTGSYSKQALIMVNYGDATGSEILHFTEMVKSGVAEKFDILLEEEVNIY